MTKLMQYSVSAIALTLLPLTVLAQNNTNPDPGQDQSQPRRVISSSSGSELIGRDLYDIKGDNVGEIDGVVVDRNGNAKSLIVDVSNWLQSEKLIAIPFQDLQTNSDGELVSPKLTREQAESIAAYRYQDESYRGQLLTENGQRYNMPNSGTNTNSTATSSSSGTNTNPTTSPTLGANTNSTTSPTTGTNTYPTNSPTTAAPTTLAREAVTNPDGSMNMSQLIGLDVRNAQNEDLGDISEVILDQQGKIKGVVVSVGGVLGVGAHPVFLNWKDIHLQEAGDDSVAMISISKDRLKEMPEYRRTPSQ